MPPFDTNFADPEGTILELNEDRCVLRLSTREFLWMGILLVCLMASFVVYLCIGFAMWGIAEWLPGGLTGAGIFLLGIILWIAHCRKKLAYCEFEDQDVVLQNSYRHILFREPISSSTVLFSDDREVEIIVAGSSYPTSLSPEDARRLKEFFEGMKLSK